MKFKRSSGILAHPTSFPSRYGIGDLGQGTIDFINFLEKSGQKLWQVLPFGPTSFCDSPYQSFSTFAGNPLLISPDILKEENYLTDNDLASVPSFDAFKISYGEVINYKTGLYKKAFEAFKKNASETQKTNYEKFCQSNKDWLNDYSLFVALKNYFIQERDGTFETPEYKEFAKANKKTLTEEQINDFFYGAVWLTWPEAIKTRKVSAIEEWSRKLNDEIEYCKFLQYEFFRQWNLVHNYAKKKDVKIIGDIPIFVALDSSDVWGNAKLYMLNQKGYPSVVAGVPPDYFSETGQLWGNPLYDWAEHKKENYAWWIKRVQKTLALVDILRIDHFRGFAAYWAVPFGEKTAINGKWCNAPGKELFTEIKRQLGDLPIIAEDLGVLTPDVEDLRDSFNLPGMKVLQFGFDPDGSSDHAAHNINTSNLVVYTGTHDNDTTVGWYESSDDKTKDYFRRYLNVSGDDVSWDLIRLCLASNAKIAIMPIQDLMSLGNHARMNLPGVPSGNWQFRYTTEMLSDDISARLLYLSKLFYRTTTKE